MAHVFRGILRLARPGNVLMAALGAVAGALAAPGDPSTPRLLFVTLGTMFGVAGGNAINDARDAAIDLRAHPTRPIPRGDLTAKDAEMAGWAFFAAALVFLGFVGSAATMFLGVVFVVGLLWYEYRLKPMGLPGNVAISVIVGGTFVLGATAVTGASSFAGSLLPRIGWTPLVFALLAALATLAREIFKDLQDQEFDAAWRQTLPLKMGARTAFTLARTFLLLGVFFGLLPAALHLFGWRYVVLVLPALSVFAVTMFVTEAGRAATATKFGMLLALFGFVAIGLI